MRISLEDKRIDDHFVLKQVSEWCNSEKVNDEDAFSLRVSNHGTELLTIRIHYSLTSINDNTSRLRISFNSQSYNRFEGNVYPATLLAIF